MKEQTPESPLPWAINVEGGISDSNGDWVGDMDLPRAKDEAFTIRAVNTHAALVEALRLLQYEMANCISASASAEFSDEVKVKLSEALRQAEEGK